MKKTRRLFKPLFAVLSLAFILTVFVFAVAAADEPNGAAKVGDVVYDSLDEALNAVLDPDTGTGGTVILLSDAEINEAHSVAKDITLDLNGKTLTSNVISKAEIGYNKYGTGAFVFDVSNVNFSIVGSGTINVTDRFITGASAPDNNSAETSASKMTINIDGGKHGIKINHQTSAYDNSSEAKQYNNPLVCTPRNSNSYFRNLDVYSSASDSDIFVISKDEGQGHFYGVKIRADKAMSTDHNGRSNKAAIVQSQFGCNIFVSHCSIVTSGLAAFKSENPTIHNFQVSDSYIDVGTYNYPDGIVRNDKNSNPHTSSPASLIFKNYTEFKSNDVIFENCDIIYDSMICGGNNTAGKSMIFRGTSLTQRSTGNAFFHKMNVTLEAGSSLSSETGNRIYGANDAILLLTLKAGARFDENTYNKIMFKNTGKYTAGQIAYEDGTYPAASGSIAESTTYRIVYDPVGNYEAPYVVVKVDGDALKDENGVDISKYTGGEKLYYSEITSPTIWDAHETSTNGKLTVGRNNVWKYTAGSALPTGKQTAIFFKGNTGADIGAYNLFVFDFDIATDSAKGFVESELTIHARATADGGGSNVGVYRYSSIKADGTLTDSNGAPTKVKLNIGEWNHISVAVDTSANIAHVYANGEYVCSATAYNKDATAVFLFAPKFTVSKANEETAGASMMIDNVSAMGYLPLSEGGSAAAVSDYESYLRPLGEAYDNGAVSDAINVAGVILKDADEAVKLNSAVKKYATSIALNGKKEHEITLGIYADLSANVDLPQRVTVPGSIRSNGYTMAIGDVSLHSELKDGLYTFTATVAGVKLNVSVYSDFGINLYIPVKYNVSNITVDAKAYTEVSVIDMNNEQYYKITAFKNAELASSDITVEMDITKDGISYGRKCTKINIAAYAKRVLERASSDADERELMYFMLTYANEAAKLLLENVENDAAIKAILDNSAYFTGADISDYNFDNYTAPNISFIFASSTIDIKSGSLAYKYTLAENAPEFELSIGGKVYTDKDVKDGVLTVSGLKVYNFAEDVQITSGDFSCTFNNLTYFAKYHNENPEECSALVKAFYNYARNAKAYHDVRISAE